MTSTIDSPRTAPAPALTPAPVRPPAPRRERGVGHVVAIVVGVLMLLPGLGILAGGTTLAVASAVVADDDSWFRYTLDRVESDGVAVAATDLWFDEADGDAPWVFDWLDVDLRLRVEPAGTDGETFIGVARTADVEEYLGGAEWSDVTELDGRVVRLETVPGASSVEPPTEVGIWAESVTGAGEQELAWRARGGAWSIVVMNADGSPGVSADVELGARSGAVVPIAVTLMVVGGVLTLSAIALIVVGARGRRRPVDPQPGTPAIAATWPAPPAPAAPAERGPMPAG